MDTQETPNQPSSQQPSQSSSQQPNLAYFQQPMGQPPLPSPAPKSSKGRAVGTIVMVSLVILALAAAGAWYLFFRGGDDSEERAAYDRIIRYQNENQLDSLDEALNSYFDTYTSDAFHYSQLKDLHDRFFTERADWQAAEKLHSVEAVRNFLDAHPDGVYLKSARRQLDSLSFVMADKENTREALERYLNQFPEGVYASEARKKMNELDNVELTIEEKTSVKQTLDAHFDALAENDRAAITATLAEHVNSYIGKANPELEDIYAYMRSMHSSSRTIVFLVKNIDVTKVEFQDQNLYSAKFNLEEETYTHSSSRQPTLDTDAGQAGEDNQDDAPKPNDVKHFSGTAVLDASMRITSLVLRQ